MTLSEHGKSLVHNIGHALRALYVLPLVALSLVCGARTVKEDAGPSFVRLNGLAFYSVTIDDIMRTFGEPDSVVLVVSRVEQGDVYRGLVLKRSFRKDEFEDFRKLSVPANKDYYSVRFHYADSWLSIATPDITEMTADGRIPADMSFAGHFEIDGFSFCDSNWVLSTDKGSVTVGSSLEELKKISFYMRETNITGNPFHFSLLKDDSTWFVNLKDGKITALSFMGVSWI